MKNTLILLLTFLLLGGFAYYYLSNDEGDSNRWDTSLTIEDTDRVHKIFLAQKTGTSYTLEKKSDGWYVNDEFKIRPAKIKYILETLRKQRVKYIPSRARAETAVKRLAGSGIKVETYDEKGETILNFYVGGMTNDERGTYMIAEDSNQPLVMHIPGWEGGLRVRFWDDIDNWKDRSVFSDKVADIQSVKVDYPRQKSQSFEIINKDGNYEVFPIYKTTAIIKKEPTAAIVENYLSEYQSKVAEGFINDVPGRDSIKQLVPFCEITVTKKDGKSHYAKFFPQRVDVNIERPQDSYKVFASKGYISRYNIDNNDKEFQIGQQIVFGKLFVSYDYFFR